MPLIELGVQDLTFPQLLIALQHSEGGFNQKPIARLMMGHAIFGTPTDISTHGIKAYPGRRIGHLSIEGCNGYFGVCQSQKRTREQGPVISNAA